MRTFLPRARRTRALLTGAALIALGVAGIAIAGPGGPASINVTSATFAANTLVRSHTETCTPTPPGDVITATDVVFTGTMTSSDARLGGPAGSPITIHAKSVWDATHSVGSLKGEAEYTSPPTPPGGHFHGHFDAVQVGTLVQGWLNGHLGDGSHVTGSFSATFSTTTGFSSGTFGSGGATNAAIVWSGHCDKAETSHPAKPHDDNDKHHH